MLPIYVNIIFQLFINNLHLPISKGEGTRMGEGSGMGLLVKWYNINARGRC